MTRGQLGQAKRTITLLMNRCFNELERHISGNGAEAGSANVRRAVKLLQRVVGGRMSSPRVGRNTTGTSRSHKRHEERLEDFLTRVQSFLTKAPGGLKATEIVERLDKVGFDFAEAGFTTSRHYKGVALKLASRRGRELFYRDDDLRYHLKRGVPKLKAEAEPKKAAAKKPHRKPYRSHEDRAAQQSYLIGHITKILAKHGPLSAPQIVTELNHKHVNFAKGGISGSKQRRRSAVALFITGSELGREAIKKVGDTYALRKGAASATPSEATEAQASA